MTRAALTRLLIAVALTIPTLIGAAAGLSPQTAATSDAARLKALYFQRQYDTVVAEGKKLSAPDPEASAWTAMAMAKAGREADGLAAAEKMVAALPDSGWSWVALSSVRQTQGDHVEDAIKASERAIALMPDHLNAVVIRTGALAQDAKRRDEALAFIESKRAALGNPAQLLVSKAYVLYLQSTGKERNEAKSKAAFDTFADARTADPMNVDASFLAGTYLGGLRRGAEAFPLLKSAAALAPNTTAVQGAYWRALNARQDIAADAKLAEIQSSIEKFVAANSHRSGALFSASSMYGDLKLTAKQKELEDIVLGTFFDTIDAEWVLAYRWREYRPGPDGKLSPEYRKTLQTYLDRPNHYHEGLWGEAYRSMASVLLNDTTTKPEELLPIVRGMAKYETSNVHIIYGSMPVTMADKRIILDEAEKMAREGLPIMIKKVESQKDIYDGAGAYERALNSMAALSYDALGWVLFAKDNIPEAEKQLLKSYELNHDSRLNLYHLGKFYETGKQPAKAEDYYVKGLGVSAPGVNPSEAALKTVFEGKKTGGSFDAYLAELREADRTRRRTKIMGERTAEPKAAPAFNLKTLDGKMVSLESLKGKVVAINYWGIWCGWCVQELPDYQKLYEQYKNDPNVLILTIDNDQNPNDVAPWMTEKKFTFPVLFDDGFVAKAGITAFPTTWFLDRDGRIAFTKVGWSEKLQEEFGWRIEAIKK